jgi:hypothetical protein
MVVAGAFIVTLAPNISLEVELLDQMAVLFLVF